MAKVLMKGNEAIAEAAVRAGCRNYFAYPITPQSEVAEYLSRRLPEVGGVFLQGESEVAVSYMIFGAAAAGERVFTTSSSPGISLMCEGLSYIAAAELPCVFVNIMRGGPGLGGILPSQADYFQAVKGGGHGDYRLLVLAPASVQEAVEMMMEAFALAEKYRNPVMILGDGLIGQMMEPVAFPEQLKRDPPSPDGWATNGMDRRGGDRRNLIRTLYLVPAELNAHNLKLQAKYERMRREEVRWESCAVDPEIRLLLVSYGTMSRVCRTAIDRLREEGIPAGMIRPRTLFPFPREAIFAAAGQPRVQAVLSVEMSMGQLVEDVDWAVRGARPVFWYGKCGGEVPTPEDVMEEARRVLRETA